MKTGSLLLIGGGAAALVAGLFVAKKKSDATTEAIQKAVAGAGPGPKVSDRTIIPAAPPTPRGGAQFDAMLTGYWPKSARPDERKMEGGMKDRLGRPLHSLEDFQKDPVAHPYVSVSADPEIFPYGQRLSINVWPGVIFRVVDTGSHFTGLKKVYRWIGREPLDINVDSSSTIVPKKNTVATIFPGDNFATGGKGQKLQTVATAKFKDQVVSGDVREQLVDAIVGAYYAALEKGL
jgi:hypothetical protein